MNCRVNFGLMNQGLTNLDLMNWTELVRFLLVPALLQQSGSLVVN